MARPLRIDRPDGIYHITSRGLERRDICLDDIDRDRWCKLLSLVAQRRQWRVFAWVLMGNHYHLFLEVPRADLSGGMHDLNSGYAGTFNRRHKRCGPLFQGRFKSVLVQREYHYLELSRYIHLNPVRAGLCRLPADYPWSSCRVYLGLEAAPPWLCWRTVLSEHGSTLGRARAHYRRFLEAGATGHLSSPMEQAEAGCILGDADFVAKVRSDLQDETLDNERPAIRAMRDPPDLAQIDAVVARIFKEDAVRLHQRTRGCLARLAAIYLGRTQAMLPAAIVGQHYGRIGPQAVSNAVTRLEQLREVDAELSARIEQCAQRLAGDALRPAGGGAGRRQ